VGRNPQHSGMNGTSPEIPHAVDADRYATAGKAPAVAHRGESGPGSAVKKGELLDGVRPANLLLPCRVATLDAREVVPAGWREVVPPSTDGGCCQSRRVKQRKQQRPSSIRAMAERKPERVVCLEEGFADNDQLKANAVPIFTTKGVTSFKTV